MGKRCIVILAREGELPLGEAQVFGQGVETIRVANGYEAGAELLAGAALALVIDLPCLTPPHRKLLHVARQAGAEILGVGNFPPGLSAEDLSGMRLISRDDLPTSLRAIVERSKPQPGPMRLTPAKDNDYHDESYTVEAPQETFDEGGSERD